MHEIADEMDNIVWYCGAHCFISLEISVADREFFLSLSYLYYFLGNNFSIRKKRKDATNDFAQTQDLY
jgi:hypothetical protein